MANVTIPWKTKVPDPPAPKPEQKVVKEWKQSEIIKKLVQTEPTQPKSSESHKCPNCGESVPDERTELLGVVTCAKCTPQKPKPLGVLDFSHKTGGVLMITDDMKLFKLLKKPINQQR